MSIKEDFINALDTYPALNALVGVKNYWRNLPQEPEYPNTVSHQINTDPKNVLAKGPSSRFKTAIQTDVRGSNEQSADEVADEVINAICNSTTFSAYLTDRYDNPLEDLTNTDRIILIFSVHYSS